MRSPVLLMVSCFALLPAMAQEEEDVISTYQAPNSYGENLFVGQNSGNETMAPVGGLWYLASYNTAVGPNTLTLNETGWQNTAVGGNALWANRTGYFNTAVGYVALASNIYGSDNTALGYSSMYLNETGGWNTAVGLQSLYSNVSGDNNVAVGRDAVFSNTTGNWNTGLGVDAIPGGETGDGNTGVGGESGYTENPAHQNVTGNFNTWVGYQSGPSSPAQHNGVIGIGYRSKTSKDWQAVFGSPRIDETLLYGNVGINADDPSAMLVVMGDTMNLTGAWDVFSDSRLKSDIERFEDGLDVVMQLRPVSFKYNGKEGLPSDQPQVGLLAQEVERVAPEMISVHEGKDIEDVRTMSTQALPYLLLNAVQELQEEIAVLEARIRELEGSSAAD